MIPGTLYRFDPEIIQVQTLMIAITSPFEANSIEAMHYVLMYDRVGWQPVRLMNRHKVPFIVIASP